MIIIKGVKKSAKDVTKGIKKLFGSFPLLNRKTAHTNRRKKREINKVRIVKLIITIIIKGLIISIPVKNAMLYPKIMRNVMLKIIVINKLMKSSRNL